MKRFRRIFILIILFLFFLLVMDYPFLARLINEKNQGEVVTGYEEATTSLEEKQIEEMLQEAQEYNQLLASGLGDEAEEGTYESLLNASDDGMMGTIEIPKIKVVLPIYHGTTDDVLQDGAGHLEGSSLPIGGESTHACISAHRGFVRKKLFTDLDELKKGDYFMIHVLGDTLYYQVEKIETVRPDDMDSLAIQEGKDLVTLITCTPYGLNTHRLLVHGTRVEYGPFVEEEIQQQEEEVNYRDWWWLGVSAVLVIGMVILLIRYFRKVPKQ